MARHNIQRKQLALSITSALLVSGIASTASADLTLNFQPGAATDRISSPANLDCRDRSISRPACVRGTNLADPDMSPFYQELVQEPDGQRYYHVIVGDPTSDFALEYYISTVSSSSNWFTGAPYNASGGAMFNGGIDSQPSSPLARDPLSQSDPSDPFGNSGNASGNPKRVIFSMIVDADGLRQEVTKDTFLNKPRLNQTISDVDLASTFELDMTNSTYDDMTTTGNLITNRNTVLDAATGATLFDFDAATDSQVSDVNAGEYVYNPGTFLGQSFGTYTYSESDFNVYEVEWSIYSNPTNVPNQ